MMWLPFFGYTRKPFAEDFLPLQDGHKIYYRQYGNPNGIPVLSFHGGPGGSSRPKYAELFSAAKYRFIQFDQRGCGNSKADDVFYKNDTSYLLQDAARLLEYLHITTPIIVHGCSWGSTLALLFAELFPQKVSHIIVSSVFLARPYDTDWVSKESERFYPDIWNIMREKVRKTDIYPVYRKLLFSDKENDNLKALKYLASYEYMLGSLNPKFSNPQTVDAGFLQAARIAFYYEEHKYFMSPKQIISNIESIKHIPTLIVHNRMDFCCPLKQAWDLHQALSSSKLIINAGYGHTSPQLHKRTKKEIKEFLG
jgi:proline iminopeptidase